VEWDTFLLPKAIGEAKFWIRIIPPEYTHFKFIIISNYGDDVTYLNSITFYRDPTQNTVQDMNSEIIRQVPFRKENSKEKRADFG